MYNNRLKNVIQWIHHMQISVCGTPQIYKELPPVAVLRNPSQCIRCSQAVAELRSLCVVCCQPNKTTRMKHCRGPVQLSRYSDLLRTGRHADRIPVVTRFSASVQTGSGTHPASYTMGTGSIPGVRRPGRGVGHPPHIAARLKKE